MNLSDPATVPALLSAIRSLPEHRRLVVVAGETATGKTDLAVRLALQCGGEVVNADSRQLYRGIAIGSAAATPEEQRGVPHHLLSVLEPDQVFTLAQYQQAAFEKIDAILSRGHVPFLVGGTGLYVNAVALNYAIPDIPPDQDFRHALLQRLSLEGFERLHAELAAHDPQSAGKILPGQERRLIRALEILRSGKSKNALEGRHPPRYDSLFIFLTCNRTLLAERIRSRVLGQLDRGVLAEVQTLLEQGYGPETHALDSINCKEWIPYLRGTATLEESTQLAIRNNLRYAKRQATWFSGLRKVLPPERIVLLRSEG